MLTGLGVERNQEPESSLEAGVWGRAEEAGLPVGTGSLSPPKAKTGCVFQTIVKAN